MITGIMYYLVTAILILLLFALYIAFNLKRLYNKVLIEKKQLEETVIVQKEELEKKTQFFSNISHDLKTPLSVILGAIQLIEQKPPNVPVERRKSSKNLQILKQNSYRLLKLVTNILDITRIDTGYIKINMANCNIVYLIEEIAQSVMPYVEQRGLSLEFDTEAEEVVTAVDIDKIERVILNLLSNAIKFTGPGGKISVKVGKSGEKANISIKDTGAGIPGNMHKAIFERYRQVDSPLTKEVEGSGIGLSLVKSFIDLHNGNITVHSEENEGSEFIIELPINLCESKENHPMNDHPDKIVEVIKVELSDIYNVAS